MPAARGGGGGRVFTPVRGWVCRYSVPVGGSNPAGCYWLQCGLCSAPVRGSRRGALWVWTVPLSLSLSVVKMLVRLAFFLCVLIWEMPGTCAVANSACRKQWKRGQGRSARDGSSQDGCRLFASNEILLGRVMYLHVRNKGTEAMRCIFKFTQNHTGLDSRTSDGCCTGWLVGQLVKRCRYVDPLSSTDRGLVIGDW